MHGKGRAVGSWRKSPFLSQATNEHQEKPSQTACPITAVTKLGVLPMGALWLQSPRRPEDTHAPLCLRQSAGISNAG